MKIKPQVLGRYLQYTHNHQKTIVANIFLKLISQSYLQLFYIKPSKRYENEFHKRGNISSSKIMEKSPILVILRGIKIKMQWDSYHFTHSVSRNLEFDSTKIGEDMGTPSHCWSRISSFQLNHCISSVSCQNCLIYTFLCSSF